MSTMSVPIADIMATSPVNGNFPQGFSPRQGEVSLSNASGSMWMKPVARITPAAKALIMKKMWFSGFRAGTFFPSRGMLTPAAPATRMEAIAASLYLSDSPPLLGWSECSASSHEQSDKTKLGRKKMRRMRRLVAVIQRVGAVAIEGSDGSFEKGHKLFI